MVINGFGSIEIEQVMQSILRGAIVTQKILKIL